VVVYEKDYKTKNGNVYTLQNEKTGKKMTLNACDFEPYIDIELTAEQLRKDIDKIKEALSQHLLIDFVAKNKDTFEKLVEESKEEKLEKEIREAYEEWAGKNTSEGSVKIAFRAGYIAGRERDEKI
jgi:topoisomerase IA-like protein